MGPRLWMLLAAFLISGAGNWIYRLALPLLVLDLTGSAVGTGALYALENLPLLLFSMLGGAIADRFPRRLVLVTGDVAAAVIASGIALFVAAGARPVWLLYALAFVLASVEPLYYPAFRSLIPSLATPDLLPTVNARVHVAEYGVNAVGPLLAGVLVETVGYEITLAVNAASFALSALLILLIRGVPAPESAAGRTILGDVREALRYCLRDNPIIRASTLIPMVNNFFVWLLLANVVFYLTTYHSYTPDQIGVVFAMQGVGAVAGALAGARLLRRVPPGLLVAWSTAVGGLAMLALIPARHPLAVGAAWMVQFAAAGASIVSTATLRQWLVPDRLLGRVFATARMIAWSPIPLASLLAGVVESTWHNSHATFAISGVAWLATGVAAARSPLRDARPPEPATPPP
ncbi:MFS transporter [Bailinhaonella thermotolerans]|uniref:MFS transporter n=1 Tax=Bailinhaonella thermotolerans TaxID=1070861 RepID=A0A3A4AUV9_9ACTN|nr:MFS transporter [Bailinhaonella thermotolerans]RJL32491.1 MFS transporter [Bailinhaonella thermotolerans]